MSVNLMPVNQMLVGHISLDQLSFDQMSVNQMLLGHMSVDKMSVGQMVFDRRTWNLFNISFQKVEKMKG